MGKSPDAQLKVCVVGCGGVAQVVHLPILIRMPSVKVVAVCDLDLRKANVVANRFGIEKAYSDILEMCAQCEPDALFILTPNNMHLPMSLIALKHGAHVFIEKPGAKTGAEAQKIADEANKRNKHVMVGMYSRFRPDLRALKKIIEAGTLGDIFFIKAEWLQAKFQSIKQSWLLNKKIAGGGVLMDLGIQLIDTSWWLTGKPKIESVKAYARQINPGLKVEDFCSVYLKFAGNLKMAFHSSWNFPIAKDRFIGEIFGDGGSINLNPFFVEKISHGKGVDITPKGFDRQAAQIFTQAYQTEIKHFVDLIRGKTKRVESNIEDAVNILNITDAIYQSLSTNREVKLA